MRNPDLYHRLGGVEGVSRIVLALYDRVCESERLEPYFRHADMRRLLEHQAGFLGSVLGGPGSLSDEELAAVPQGLDIQRDEFREMLALLRSVLEATDLSAAELHNVIQAFQARENCIVHSRPGPGARVA